MFILDNRQANAYSQEDDDQYDIKRDLDVCRGI